MEYKRHRSAIYDMFILENPIKNGGIREDDETKAPGLASVLLPHNRSAQNVAVVSEMLLELVLRSVPRNPTDE